MLSQVQRRKVTTFFINTPTPHTFIFLTYRRPAHKMSIFERFSHQKHQKQSAHMCTKPDDSSFLVSYLACKSCFHIIQLSNILSLLHWKITHISIMFVHVIEFFREIFIEKAQPNTSTVSVLLEWFPAVSVVRWKYSWENPNLQSSTTTASFLKSPSNHPPIFNGPHDSLQSHTEDLEMELFLAAFATRFYLFWMEWTNCCISLHS